MPLDAVLVRDSAGKTMAFRSINPFLKICGVLRWACNGLQLLPSFKPSYSCWHLLKTHVSLKICNSHRRIPMGLGVIRRALLWFFPSRPLLKELEPFVPKFPLLCATRWSCNGGEQRTSKVYYPLLICASLFPKIFDWIHSKLSNTASYSRSTGKHTSNSAR